MSYASGVDGKTKTACGYTEDSCRVAARGKNGASCSPKPPAFANPSAKGGREDGRKYCLSVNTPAKFECTFKTEASCESAAADWRKKGTSAGCYLGN